MENSSSEDIRSLRNRVREISEPIHVHDKKLAVLEMRVDSNEERQERTESDVKDTKTMVQLVLDRLAEHTERENKDRNKLLLGIITTLLTVIGSVIYFVWDLVIKPRLGH